MTLFTQPMIPPAAVQRGRKDIQYMPVGIDADLAGAYLLSELLKNENGVLEIDAEKLVAATKLTSTEKYALVVWKPVKKDNLGDVAFNGPGQAAIVEDKIFVQLIERPEEPQIVAPSSPQLVDPKKVN